MAKQKLSEIYRTLDDIKSSIKNKKRPAFINGAENTYTYMQGPVFLTGIRCNPTKEHKEKHKTALCFVFETAIVKETATLSIKAIIPLKKVLEISARLGELRHKKPSEIICWNAEQFAAAETIADILGRSYRYFFKNKDLFLYYKNKMTAEQVFNRYLKKRHIRTPAIDVDIEMPPENDKGNFNNNDGDVLEPG
jgi:hypothetical protein